MYRDIEEDEVGIAPASGRDLANDFVLDMSLQVDWSRGGTVFTMNTGNFSGLLLVENGSLC